MQSERDSVISRQMKGRHTGEDDQSIHSSTKLLCNSFEIFFIQKMHTGLPPSPALLLTHSQVLFIKLPLFAVCGAKNSIVECELHFLEDNKIVEGM